MARKSKADLAVVIGGRFGERPAPPPGLSEAEAAIWRATVNSEAVDFFSTAAVRAILVDYCRHKEAADRLSKLVADFKLEWLKTEDGTKRYDLLLRMRERETRASVTMATKLRLTNQSRIRKDASGSFAKPEPPKASRPWEA